MNGVKIVLGNANLDRRWKLDEVCDFSGALLPKRVTEFIQRFLGSLFDGAARESFYMVFPWHTEKVQGLRDVDIACWRKGSWLFQ